jgi:hypothetical protein
MFTRLVHDGRRCGLVSRRDGVVGMIVDCEFSSTVE